MLKIVGKFVLGLATPLTATMIGAYLVQQYVPPRVVTVAPPPPPPPSMMMPASELAKFVSPPAAATDPAALVAAPAASRQVTLPARPAAAPRPAREEAPQQHARMMGKIAAFPAPVIARVHGTVAGGGNGVVAAADIAIADRDTTFVFSEARLGIVPAVVSPFVVYRIGAARAASLWMTAERFHGDAAERWGLIHRSVDGLDLDGAIDDAIANIRAGAPGAQVEARRLAQRVSEMTAEDLATLNAQMRVTEEAVEGLQAFIERRRPGWAE